MELVGGTAGTAASGEEGRTADEQGVPALAGRIAWAVGHGINRGLGSVDGRQPAPTAPPRTARQARGAATTLWAQSCS